MSYKLCWQELEAKLMNRMEGIFRQQLDSEIKRLYAEIEQLKMEMIDLKAKTADQEILMNRILRAQVVNNNPKSGPHLKFVLHALLSSCSLYLIHL